MGKPIDQISAEFDLEIAVVRRMMLKYDDVIEQLRDDIQEWQRGEPGSLWAKDREQRIKAYQDDIERIDEIMRVGGWERGLQAEKTKLLHVIADEAGQLPSRGGMAAEEGKTMQYEFNGIDIGDLT